MNTNKPRDPLLERLGKEAQRERPPFSPELHDQILQRIRHDRLRINASPSRHFKWAAAAAVILIASVTWMLRSHRVATEPSFKIALKQPEVPSLPTANLFTMEIPGVLSAQLYPPEITIGPSIFQRPNSSSAPQLQSIESLDFPTSPQWLIARFQAPTTSAQAVLKDLMPPELSDLVNVISANTQHTK